ncbi:MAG: LptF/LptG family permease, partial [Burkholderiaceae bacterium]|nr:LptF/LptG family permease [Burkholderiaceae bacterium]
MSVLQRYFAKEIFRAVLFVMVSLLALFSFFDLTSELQVVNQGGYRLQHALLYVLLGMPGYLYEFMPIAVLIGTIYVMAQYASNSEFTIMRAAGMSSLKAGGMLIKIGLVFILVTFVFGEVLSPISTKLAKKVKTTALGATITQEFRTGLWTKDLVRENGLKGNVIGSRFLNVKEILPNRSLVGVKVFEFDNQFNLTREIIAANAEYVGKNIWRLSAVNETSFPKSLNSAELSAVSSVNSASKDIVSEITPDILAVL